MLPLMSTKGRDRSVERDGDLKNYREKVNEAVT